MSLVCEKCDFTKVIGPFILGLLTTIFLTHALKYIFKVERPNTYKGGRDRYSFPSGHSSVVTFIFFYMFLTSPSIFTFLLLLYMWNEFAYKSYTGGYHRLNEIIIGTIFGGLIAVYFKRQFP